MQYIYVYINTYYDTIHVLYVNLNILFSRPYIYNNQLHAVIHIHSMLIYIYIIVHNDGKTLIFERIIFRLLEHLKIQFCLGCHFNFNDKATTHVPGYPKVYFVLVYNA